MLHIVQSCKVKDERKNKENISEKESKMMNGNKKIKIEVKREVRRKE